MKCSIISIKGDWSDIYGACQTTIGKEHKLGRTPSPEWRYNILKSEHSPIRKLVVEAKFYDIPYWVVMHLVRHKIGVEHWVRTQRSDRTGVDRNTLYQGSLVDYEFEANAQAIINISRKRLCNLASKETREAWQMFLSELSAYEPELVRCCLPDCEYRGGNCWELKPCTRG
jgi:hypothetical protein